MLSSYIEKIYRSMSFVRYNERDTLFYFSYTDFDGVNMEPYSFKNKWGDSLSAYFYYPENEIDGRIIIFEHGLGGGHRSYMREIALLVSHGYRVLAYDRTGCASSPGDGTKGLVSSLCDLDYCIRALRADERYKNSRISVIGHSWGGFSSMNIPKFHPDVEHIVAMSGFRSLDAMMEQRMPGPLKRYRSKIHAIEGEINPEYVSADAAESLMLTDAKTLIIHSTDDKMVSCKIHFDTLKMELSGRENIKFLKVSGRGHNPNYSPSAAKYLEKFSKILKRKSKKLNTDDKKQMFVDSFDWYKMTEQDDTVWKEIFDTLDN